jgi:hypothetical protein
MSRVAAGFFSFTQITDPGAHRAYNEWHQLDHLPQQHELDSIVFGQRWVLTPACRRARLVAAPLLDPVHYVTFYLMTEPLAGALDAFFDLGARLRAEGRFFEARRSVLSGPFTLSAAQAAPRVRVTGEVVGFRPHQGIYVVVETADLAAPPALGPTAYVALDGVAGVWQFAPCAPDPRWRNAAVAVTVCFLDAEPTTVSADLDSVLAEHPAGSALLFAGPLETVTPWEWGWFDPPGTTAAADSSPA